MFVNASKLAKWIIQKENYFLRYVDNIIHAVTGEPADLRKKLTLYIRTRAHSGILGSILPPPPEFFMTPRSKLYVVI